MKTLLTKLAVMMLAVTTLNVAAAEADKLYTAPVLETKLALRDAWVEHIFWIRNYVLATRNQSDEQAEVANQEILANAKILADSISPFYGEGASNQLLHLLAGHWGAVKDYNGAVLNGSTSGQTSAAEAMGSNAHEIAEFLNSANPFLPSDVVFGLLSAHGAHHMAQIDQIELRDFEKEARTWAAMRLHMHTIADSITDALSQQFPQDFGISSDHET